MALDQLEDSTIDKTEMGFFDHIDELRKHIIRSVVAVLVCAVVIFFNKSLLFDTVLFGPIHVDFWTYRLMCDLSFWLTGTDVYCVKEMGFVLSNIDITGQFTQHLFISFISGFVVSFPFVLYQFWAFIKPALSRKEITYARGFVFFSSVLFFVGILFGYFMLAPLSINFLGSYQVSALVSNEINLESYISFLTTLVFACGLIFEMPMLVYFLAKIGILGSALMSKYRRYALVVILILAGILTPSPDMASQIMMALPLYGLYEISILVAKGVEKRKLNK
ncbi:MAG: twin-arginine translocase subunit TatC [Bacteroidia bacterium]|nr:twin-arginine translocase subunit TatC [Bacteroidia bacterium]MCF8427428.1 twin-arginine translocase subunit TatC [Bacteroidia bacterium]MCF8447089.1 twin-arginine translocase subunit TatC [Bacteroidia bacterium]